MELILFAIAMVTIGTIVAIPVSIILLYMLTI